MHSDTIKVKRIYGALAKVHAERNFVLFPEVRATDYRRLLGLRRYDYGYGTRWAARDYAVRRQLAGKFGAYDAY